MVTRVMPLNGGLNGEPSHALNGGLNGEPSHALNW